MLFMAYPYIKQHYTDPQRDPASTEISPIPCQNKMRKFTVDSFISTQDVVVFLHQQEKAMLFTVQSYDK